MIFNSRIDIYQPTKSLEHGEYSAAYSLVEDTPLYCHLKFTGSELLSGDKKQSIRRAKVTYEVSPVVLTSRDVLKVGTAFFRLLYIPTQRKGLSNRAFYEVEIVEAFNVEVT